MDIQSILEKYKYNVESETQLQVDKDFWADESKEELAEIDKTRKQILERFFSRLQRHEELLDLIKDGCEKAQKELERDGKNSCLHIFDRFEDYYESAFNIEKSRFAEVFQSELINLSSRYHEFKGFLTSSDWDNFGSSAGLKSRDKQSKLCDRMVICFFQWHELFLQHKFYDAGAHRRYVLDIDS